MQPLANCVKYAVAGTKTGCRTRRWLAYSGTHCWFYRQCPGLSRIVLYPTDVRVIGGWDITGISAVLIRRGKSLSVYPRSGAD